jgi:hypothetical protein
MRALRAAPYSRFLLWPYRNYRVAHDVHRPSLVRFRDRRVRWPCGDAARDPSGVRVPATSESSVTSLTLGRVSLRKSWFIEVIDGG